MIYDIKDFLQRLFKSRLLVLSTVMFLLFLMMLMRVFSLQIVNGEEYQEDFVMKIERTLSKEATRGNIYDCNGKKFAVINLIGRVDINILSENPFLEADNIINKVKNEADIIIVDFHAEATAEKIALAYYLKDKANVIYGTHTHVQTSDERIFDTGMGYITDLGMTGPKESVLGMKVEIAIKRFTTQIPEKYAVAEGEYIFNGAIFDIDDKTNKVNEIIRINM